MNRFESIQGGEVTVHLSARSKHLFNALLCAGCFAGTDELSNETVLSAMLNMGVEQLFEQAREQGRVK